MYKTNQGRRRWAIAAYYFVVAGGQFLYNKVTGEVRYHIADYEKLQKDKITGYIKLTEK